MYSYLEFVIEMTIGDILALFPVFFYILLVFVFVDQMRSQAVVNFKAQGTNLWLVGVMMQDFCNVAHKSVLNVKVSTTPEQ